MKRAVVFAHYDPHGEVDPYVEHMLRAYRDCAATLIVISAGGTETSIAPLRDWCDVVLRRENIGHDFASWKLGAAQLRDLACYDEIIFTNDSIYGPLFDLHKLFKRTDQWDCDFWGLARNHQQRSHIQSYFFAFRQRPLTDGFFERFWNSVEILTDKDSIIERYEVGLTRRLEQENYHCVALFDQQCMSLLTRFRAGIINGSSRGRSAFVTFRSYIRNRRIHNPTHKLWRTLIEAGMPFVKVELFRKNPLEMDLQLISSYLAKHTNYDVTLIKNHVRRTGAAQPALNTRHDTTKGDQASSNQ